MLAAVEPPEQASGPPERPHKALRGDELARRSGELRELLEGDPDDYLSFDSIYTAYFHHVCRWVRAFGCPASDVDDLAQETFLVVRRRLPDFDGGNLPGWIYRIARLTVSDYRRRAWFRRVWQRRGSDPDRLMGAGSNPEERLAQRQAERLLQEALSKMSGKRSRAFFLFEVEGYTGEEIAALEGVPVATIYTRLFHARRDFIALVDRLKREEEP